MEQLNGDYTYGNGVSDNQLRAWDHLRLFKVDVSPPEKPRKVSKLQQFIDEHDK